MMIDSAQEVVAVGAAAVVGVVVADADVLVPVVDVVLRMKPPF